jgi:hypothetical protein
LPVFVLYISKGNLKIIITLRFKASAALQVAVACVYILFYNIIKAPRSTKRTLSELCVLYNFYFLSFRLCRQHVAQTKQKSAFAALSVIMQREHERFQTELLVGVRRDATRH